MRKQALHPRTAVINKAQKNQSKRARSDALLWLAANFPEAFDNSLRIRPLKIGIMSDILQHAEKAEQVGISKSKLREAVVLFTRRLDYLACLKAREVRIDLQGNPVAEVTEEEAEHASMKIKKRVEKSVKNARKQVSGKVVTHSHVNNQQSTISSIKPINSIDSHPEPVLPVYPLRSSAYTSQNTAMQSAKPSSVVVKHKAPKQYDPDAVARLKEKLGLSRKAEEKKETAE
ncbi:ProQ/FINO family protein [Legionella pneumophila]|uniref:Activator of osmoprotectant transporter ProP n=1 Tax=Legionella pneumophila subsp. pascullei TaxID=91890 RepID=A0AAX2IS38_LEGPN|nr:ProQ/FINO family protein [Legionella pneumophila]AMP88301.1 activator of prop osmoprotectant transporter [Legionella pneumophila subsp. pascullei]AMP91210.1 activator of prop osmoprotectant transporter [Legionella pneumophila subsp. pascullei]AMP94197.1 activator of prop osmoprotectant transporter [Legionella pneumophila subsp. pascullei]SQG88970.1 Activator of osmoprotectant transporter ProP [Legionella pneumophila subsp. pascullei]VEH04020.1 Activator of osmoprotectant transporter ProP [L